MSFGRQITFELALRNPPATLAVWWAERPPSMPRNTSAYLLECGGLSTELEELARCAALAARVRDSVAEMIHRAAFIGADPDQLAAAANLTVVELEPAWRPWAQLELLAGRIPQVEYDFVARRLSGGPLEHHYLLPPLQDSDAE
jgi:hypothetical protein